MNKISKSLLILAAGLSFASCIEDVDVTAYMTEDRRGEIAAEDPDKVFAASLAGMYTDMQQACYSNLSHNYFGQKSFDYLSSLMGNDMIMTGRYGMSLYHHLLDYWQESYAPTVNRWREYYGHIANANKIIKLVDPQSENSASLSYRAQALAFRGYAYLYLTYLYQHSYYTGADDTVWGKGAKYDFSNSPCVPLVLEETVEDQPRATVAEIHNQIIADLTEAYNIFVKLGQVKTSTPTDMDGCVVALYLARTYMIMHNWSEAEKYAKVVADNFDILTTEKDLLQGFSNIALPDVVMGCDITSDNSTTYMSFFSQMDVYGAGYAAIGVDRAGHSALVDRIADDDIRLQWFCCSRSTGVQTANGIVTLIRDTKYAATSEYQSVKFIGAGRDAIVATGGDGTGWDLGDYIYLRAEEAYLMLAEIYAHQNNSSKAVETLNSFMRTRQPSYNYNFTDKASLIEEIIYQKRVEFWGEGLEYLDNRRLNIPVDRTDAKNGPTNNHMASAKLRAEQEDPCFAYQIPISEIENNKMINEEDQN